MEECEIEDVDTNDRHPTGGNHYILDRDFSTEDDLPFEAPYDLSKMGGVSITIL